MAGDVRGWLSSGSGKVLTTSEETVDDVVHVSLIGLSLSV